jgi:hypothetical protein
MVSSPALRAADAVEVTIEAGNAMLTIGEKTQVTVYGRIAAAIEGDSDQIFSWYLDVLNDHAGVVSGYGDVQKPESDNTPSTSSAGTPAGAALRGIHDTFLGNPGAGKGGRVALVTFEVTAVAAGSATISVAAGSTVGGQLSDFLVARNGGGAYVGGQYDSASVEITVTGEPDFSGLDLRISEAGRIAFNPLPGFDHTVQFSDTLLPGSWVDVAGGPHNTGSVNQVVAGVRERYYRVVLTTP